MPPKRHQVRARRSGHHRTARRYPHAALRQIQEGGAQQAANDGNQRQVVKKPRVGQLKKIEAQIAAEERVRDPHHRHLPGAQIGEPMAHAPLAHHVTRKEHAPPDQPTEKRAEPFQGCEFNVLAVNLIPVPMRQGMGEEEIQAGNHHEAHARDSTQVDLGFQNGQID